VAGSFSITQWNTLAVSLCTSESFPKASQLALDWGRRQELYKKLIPQTDIICFEEVD
jgi:mRNA deadenylase 3'-5' endonuclease subunit Ccr4